MRPRGNQYPGPLGCVNIYAMETGRELRDPAVLTDYTLELSERRQKIAHNLHLGVAELHELSPQTESLQQASLGILSRGLLHNNADVL
jgi:hypothetical protein